MGKAFGIVALVFGAIGILTAILILLKTENLIVLKAIIPIMIFTLLQLPIPIIAIVFGGISITKDDSRGLGITGLVLGLVSLGLVLYILIP